MNLKRESLYDVTRARVHPDDVDDTFQALKESISEHKPYQHEYRQIQPDGTYQWILSRAMPQYDEEGSPVSISGVMIDITERKKTEDLYRAVTELTPQFVWISDAKGRDYLFQRDLAQLHGRGPGSNFWRTLARNPSSGGSRENDRGLEKVSFRWEIL